MLGKTLVEKLDEEVQSINQSFICHIFSHVLNLLHYLVAGDLCKLS